MLIMANNNEIGFVCGSKASMDLMSTPSIRFTEYGVVSTGMRFGAVIYPYIKTGAIPYPSMTGFIRDDGLVTPDLKVVGVFTKESDPKLGVYVEDIEGQSNIIVCRSFLGAHYLKALIRETSIKEAVRLYEERFLIKLNTTIYTKEEFKASFTNPKEFDLDDFMSKVLAHNTMMNRSTF